MGGLAFAATLLTPRMRSEVYRAVRDQCHEKLRELYIVVATPIEGPAKTSFGDIDLFVAWERAEVFPPTCRIRPPPPKAPLQDIYRVLGGVQIKSENQNMATMAIPWPKDFAYANIEPKSESEIDSSENKDEILTNGPKPQFIQVDVHICTTLDHLQWMLFKHAHGDLWNILGSTIRPFGLTVDEVGLYVRIPEIEELNKKEAKVLLSSDPSEILSFLGLKYDDKQWEEPFTSDEDIYEYATTCRLFFVKPEKTETKDDADGTGTGGEGEDATGVDKRRLKANDRRRMTYRPLFRKWVEEFLPACRASGHFASLTPSTRDGVRQQAFAYFPGVQSIYSSRLTEWRIKRQRETLWKEVIKPAVPTDIDIHQRSCCTSALKKIIMNDDDTFGGIVAPASLKDKDGLFDEDAVRAWVEKSWQEVFDVAWEMYKQRSAAQMERKASAKRTVSGSEKPVDGNDNEITAKEN
ncbi:hypothetical protein HD806DRAFT_316909 [Xylariaceae sp. AK1471]|nr:hypothetical protein HD806DRAFT_316909 [Xylariaceae sp. AK1471]